MSRRNLALRHDAMDALVFLALRCARCDSARLVAIEPGKQEDEPQRFLRTLLAAVVLAGGCMSAIIAERWVDERADLTPLADAARAGPPLGIPGPRPRSFARKGPASAATERAVLAAKARLDRERAREAWHRANPSHRRKAQPEARA